MSILLLAISYLLSHDLTQFIIKGKSSSREFIECWVIAESMLCSFFYTESDAKVVPDS